MHSLIQLAINIQLNGAGIDMELFLHACMHVAIIIGS